MATKLPREMTGAELKSMLKSSINLKSLGGVKCPNSSFRRRSWTVEGRENRNVCPLGPLLYSGKRRVGKV